MITQQTFLEVLQSNERSPQIEESDDVYGWLVGSWELQVLHYMVDVRSQEIKGELHCARVLEGRAIQDIWIMPRIPDRNADLGPTCNMFGTTLRVWDGELKAWRITWINPVTGRRDELIGRWSGKDIVQLGTHADGTPIRWTFTGITGDSFRWRGEALQPDGKTWKLEGEFLARRVS